MLRVSMAVRVMRIGHMRMGVGHDVMAVNMTVGAVGHRIMDV